MTHGLQLQRDAAADITIAHQPQELGLISLADCPAVIWNRQPLGAFQTWIDGLDPDVLPTLRAILRPSAVRRAVDIACDTAKTPPCAERLRLVEDIAALADMFADLMKAPFLRLRLACITTNACRKFHTDAMTARLICTYRGAGTQYGVSADGSDPTRVFTAQTGAPIVLRGSRWPEHPPSGFVHKSPPIEGSGATRLVLVLDPIVDPENEA